MSMCLHLSKTLNNGGTVNWFLVCQKWQHLDAVSLKCPRTGITSGQKTILRNTYDYWLNGFPGLFLQLFINSCFAEFKSLIISQILI